MWSSSILHKFDTLILRLLGSHKPSTKSGNPFLGLLPYELVTSESLTVPNVHVQTGKKPDQLYAKRLLEFTGVCTIPQAVNQETIDQCRTSANEITSTVRTLVKEQRGINPDREEGFSFKGLHQRDPGRLDIRNHIAMDSHPFNDRQFSNDAVWMPIVHSVLGKNAKLLWKGIVVTDPGCKQQAYHPDGPPISREEWEKAVSASASAESCSIDRDMMDKTVLPIHCLTVFIPLVDLTAQNGATSFLCGTQHDCIIKQLEEEGDNPGSAFGAGTPATIYANAGDATIFDIRVRHAGGANESSERRAMIYLVWAREWYDKKMHNRLLWQAGLAEEGVVAETKLFEVIDEFPHQS